MSICEEYKSFELNEGLLGHPGKHQIKTAHRRHKPCLLR